MKAIKPVFEIKGYHIDIYYQGKYFGCIPTPTPDRDELGYGGRTQVTLTEDFVYKNKKLKAGTVVTTECIPVCGKLQGTLAEKIQILQHSKAIYNR